MDFTKYRGENEGQIQLILGPMFSGKSSELLRRCSRYSYANKSVFTVKYSGDNRYSTDSVSTHDNVKMKARSCSALRDIEEEVANFDVIGIDEGQFYQDIVEFSELMASRGKVIIIAALDGTFERKPFGRILDLIPMAESVVKLNAVCQICFSEAPFSKRISGEKEVEVIGGADKYVAVCRKCFHSKNNEKQDLANVVRKRLRMEPAMLNSLNFIAQMPMSRMEMQRL